MQCVIVRYHILNIERIKNMKNRRKALLVFSLTIALMGFVACAKGEATKEIAIEKSDSVQQIEKDFFEIETKYTKIFLPEEMKKHINVKIVEDDIESKVYFSAEIEEKDCLLYTLYFGGAEGFPLGTFLSSENYVIDVTAKLEDFSEDISKEGQQQFCLLQETFNEVLVKMEENPSFSLIG